MLDELYSPGLLSSSWSPIFWLVNTDKNDNHGEAVWLGAFNSLIALMGILHPCEYIYYIQ